MKKLLALSILGCIPLALAGCGVTSSPPPPPAVAARLSVLSSSAPSTAGTPFSFTVSAVDANGGFVPSYSGTVHITSSDPQAVLPPDAALTSGTGTFQVTFKTAGVQTISANDPVKSLASGTSNPINVSPGATTKFTVSSPSPVTSGFSISVTVTAYDAFGNQATNYAGTVHLTSSDAQAALPPDSTLVNGQVFSQVTLKTIAAQTVITATDTVTVSIKGVSNSINVVSNAATHLSLSAPSAENIRATFSAAVQALDAANNVSAGYTGTVHFMSSDSGARLPVDSKLTAGTANFSVTLESVGSGAQTVTATDTVTASLTASSSINVTDVPLAINSGAPPRGKVGVVYEAHVFKKCVYNPFFGVVCTLCAYTPTNTCGTYPPCSRARQYPCIESVFQVFRFTGTGGVPPYNTWNVAVLPPGLSVNSSNGGILGTPTSPGQYPLTITMTDSGLPTETLTPPVNLTLTVDLPDAPAVRTAPPPPPAVLGQPYSYTFTASGYPPLKWTESGALPAGPTFSNTGVLSGTLTPTGSTGSFPISVTATDQFNQPSTAQAFTIVVTAHGFIATGSMATARRFHTATLLSNGKVLVAGGEDGGSTAFASAEIYDPSTGVFSPTGNMTVPRVGHTATLLTAGPNAGKVLITGGSSGGTAEAALSSAELFDPAANGGAGAFTATGSMTAARVVHTATLLKDGRVLVAGGDVIFFNGIQNTNISSLASAEIFDPSKGTFTATANMTVAREAHTATLLNDGTGRVLIVGGSDGALGNSSAATVYGSAELFNPAANGGAGAFTATAGMMTAVRIFHSATLLGGSNGKVLIAGGMSSASVFLATGELFDPATGRFTLTTGSMEAPRFYHDATLLNDGTVLLSGGNGPAGAVSTAELYDPALQTFSATGSMIAARIWHTSTLLSDGTTVLVTGGGNPTNTAELYK